MKLSSILSRLDACAEARKWAKSQPDLQTAWRECRRSDWMLWLITRTTLDQNDRRLRLISCDFAEAVLIYVPAGEDRPRQAIAVARRFATGEAPREEMAAASAAARDAARDAARGAVRDAVASVAVSAAVNAAARGARAAGAQVAIDAATTAAAWAATWTTARDAQSDIIRRYFPECPEIRPELLKKAA